MLFVNTKRALTGYTFDGIAKLDDGDHADFFVARAPQRALRPGTLGAFCSRGQTSSSSWRQRESFAACESSRSPGLVFRALRLISSSSAPPARVRRHRTAISGAARLQPAERPDNRGLFSRATITLRICSGGANARTDLVPGDTLTGGRLRRSAFVEILHGIWGSALAPAQKERPLPMVQLRHHLNRRGRWPILLPRRVYRR